MGCAASINSSTEVAHGGLPLRLGEVSASNDVLPISRGEGDGEDDGWSTADSSECGSELEEAVDHVLCGESPLPPTHHAPSSPIDPSGLSIGLSLTTSTTGSNSLSLGSATDASSFNRRLLTKMYETSKVELDDMGRKRLELLCELDSILASLKHLDHECRRSGILHQSFVSGMLAASVGDSEINNLIAYLQAIVVDHDALVSNPEAEEVILESGSAAFKFEEKYQRHLAVLASEAILQESDSWRAITANPSHLLELPLRQRLAVDMALCVLIAKRLLSSIHQ